MLLKVPSFLPKLGQGVPLTSPDYVFVKFKVDLKELKSIKNRPRQVFYITRMGGFF